MARKDRDVKPRNPSDSSVKGAVEQADRILELIDEDLPERAWDKAAEFFEDIQTKVKAVKLTVEQTSTVTDRQQAALDSWEEAVRKWIH